MNQSMHEAKPKDKQLNDAMKQLHGSTNQRNHVQNFIDREGIVDESIIRNPWIHDSIAQCIRVHEAIDHCFMKQWIGEPDAMRQ